MMDKVFIVAAKRTPIGAFGGSLKIPRQVILLRSLLKVRLRLHHFLPIRSMK